MRNVGLFFSLVLVVGCTDTGHVDDPSHDEIGPLFEHSNALADDPGKADFPARCVGAALPDRGPFGGKVALTFDDGPNPQTTPGIIALLRSRNIPATFFINGRRVSGSAEEEILRDIANDPLFELANHTWSHPLRPLLHNMTAGAQAAEVDQTTDVMVAAGGSAKWFRFPFGEARCSTVDLIESRGYTSVGWHVDSLDWCFSTGGSGGRGVCNRRDVPSSLQNDLVGFTMQGVRRNNGGVVLFHDIHKFTADSLESFLDQLDAEGYEYTDINDREVFPRLNGITPPPPVFVGTTCETNATCDFDSSAFCHDAGFCTLPCSGPCPDRDGAAPTFCIEDAGRGICASQANPINEQCASLPGSERVERRRYVGSGTSSRTAVVCAPSESAPPPVGGCDTDADCMSGQSCVDTECVDREPPVTDECDAFGDDDSQGAARDLTSTSGRICADDEDWYRVEGGGTVTLRFRHDAGDLDLEAYDESGASLGESISSTDDETLTHGTTFFVRVYGYGGAANEYTIAR